MLLKREDAFWPETVAGEGAEREQSARRTMRSFSSCVVPGILCPPSQVSVHLPTSVLAFPPDPIVQSPLHFSSQVH